MRDFDTEHMRERAHIQWKRRFWFISHALLFVTVFIVTTFVLRGFRPMLILLALWAMAVALHAVAFYFLEERDISIERALTAKRERLDSLLSESDEPTYRLGTDGEIRRNDDTSNDNPDDADDTLPPRTRRDDLN